MARHPKFEPPTRAGAGFKPEHLGDILADDVRVGFFEVHAENYMGDGGAPHDMLRRLRAEYPLFIHGVGLSVGGEQPLDTAHLARLKKVVEQYEPHIVSEHLAWSTHDTNYLNDLLPVPYTRSRLAKVIEHIDEVQETLARRVLLENPSTYVAFEQCDMDELSFIREIAEHTGCGLLLDINNVFVSATNHNYSAEYYLAQFPLRHVEEIHLAGHATDSDDQGQTLLIDSHDREVSSSVWKLYQDLVETLDGVPTLIEWDNDVPSWQILKREAQRADRIADAKFNARRHAS